MPLSTEQILHPDAYFAADAPEAVRIRDVLGWKRAAAGTWGELQTRELVHSTQAAAGWGGDRYELWQSGGKSVLVMRWRWDTPRDESEFAPALREWAATLKQPHAVVDRGGAVTLVVTDDAPILRRVAAGA
jgi:hypothetical protein